MTHSEANTSTDNLVGALIDQGRYEILRVIGEGGTGRVYEARQVSIDRLVAIKVLHNHWVTDPKLVKRFKQEAFTASQLRHPNTVIVIDYGATERGDLYIVMELLKGQSLLSLLEREGPLPIERALKIIEQVCSAISEVHRCGILHRDLKPENIQIDPRDGHPDFVKLLDFSIAKLVNNDVISSVSADQNLTLQGAVFGTPQYMSPEQVRGKTLDERTDVYALGVIFYQALSGFVPFYENTPQGTMVAHLTEPVPRFEERVPHLSIHPEAAQIVYDCLEKDPKDRIASSDDLASRLADLRAQLQQEAKVREAIDHQGLGETLRFTSDSSEPTLSNAAQETAVESDQVSDQSDTSPEGSISSRFLPSAKKLEKISLKGSLSLGSRLKVPKPRPSSLSASPSKLSASLKTVAADDEDVESKESGESGRSVERDLQRSSGDERDTDHASEPSVSEREIQDSGDQEEDSFSAQATQEYNPEIHGTLASKVQESKVQESLKASALPTPSDELALKTEAAAPRPRPATNEGDARTEASSTSELQDSSDATRDDDSEEESIERSLLERPKLGSHSRGRSQTKDGEVRGDHERHGASDSNSIDEPQSEPETLHQVSASEAPQVIAAEAPGRLETSGDISILPPPLPDLEVVDALFDGVHHGQPRSEVDSSGAVSTAELPSLPLSEVSSDLSYEDVPIPSLLSPQSDREFSVSTGVFEAEKTKIAWLWPVVLFFVVASSVFVIMNKSLIFQNDRDEEATGRVTLYQLTSDPSARIFNQDDLFIATTPYEWEFLNEAPLETFSLRAHGHHDKKVTFAMFEAASGDAHRQELHVKLKPHRQKTKTSAPKPTHATRSKTRAKTRVSGSEVTTSPEKSSRKQRKRRGVSTSKRKASRSRRRAPKVDQNHERVVKAPTPQDSASQEAKPREAKRNALTAEQSTESQPAKSPSDAQREATTETYQNPHPRTVPELITDEPQPTKRIMIEIPRVD